MYISYWSRRRRRRYLEMTLKAFIPPFFVIHPVRYFCVDIDGNLRGARGGFFVHRRRRYPFVRPISPLIYSSRILRWCDNERNDRYLRCASYVGVGDEEGGRIEPPLRIPWTRACIRVNALSYTQTRTRVCTRVRTRDYVRHRLNYPRLTPKPVPPLLLWAATVIGLYRAICWLPR